MKVKKVNRRCNFDYLSDSQVITQSQIDDVEINFC